MSDRPLLSGAVKAGLVWASAAVAALGATGLLEPGSRFWAGGPGHPREGSRVCLLRAATGGCAGRSCSLGLSRTPQPTRLWQTCPGPREPPAGAAPPPQASSRLFSRFLPLLSLPFVPAVLDALPSASVLHVTRDRRVPVLSSRSTSASFSVSSPGRVISCFSGSLGILLLDTGRWGLVTRWLWRPVASSLESAVGASASRRLGTRALLRPPFPWAGPGASQAHLYKWLLFNVLVLKCPAPGPREDKRPCLLLQVPGSCVSG